MMELQLHRAAFQSHLQSASFFLATIADPRSDCDFDKVRYAASAENVEGPKEKKTKTDDGVSLLTVTKSFKKREESRTKGKHIR